MKCKSCNGSKHFNCKDCSGEGFRLVGNKPCITCDGQGLVACATCEGQGKVGFFKWLKSS
ncbi:MAG TPA: hypothetical protein VEY70_11125 [Metabacillus sp.]|nr:hypothetical protein [Metabacillus sp.]